MPARWKSPTSVRRDQDAGRHSQTHAAESETQDAADAQAQHRGPERHRTLTADGAVGIRIATTQRRDIGSPVEVGLYVGKATGGCFNLTN